MQDNIANIREMTESNVSGLITFSLWNGKLYGPGKRGMTRQIPMCHARQNYDEEVTRDDLRLFLGCCCKQASIATASCDLSC